MKTHSLFLSATMAFLFSLMAGCSTTTVPLKYQAGVLVSAPPNRPIIIVTQFTDERPKKPNDLGVVRGGYGNVLKRLRTSKPVAEVVQEVFRDALSVRGFLASDRSHALFELGGIINKLDCNYYWNKEAHAYITVKLVNMEGKMVFKKQYKSDETEAGIGAGIFASVEGLRKLAETALQGTVDKALNDRNLLTLLANSQQKEISPTELRYKEFKHLLPENAVDSFDDENEYYSPQEAEKLFDHDNAGKND